MDKLRALLFTGETYGITNRLFLMHGHATKTISGNAIIFTTDASQFGGGYAHQPTAAVNNEWEHEFIQLRKGTYYLKALYLTATVGGQVTLKLKKDQQSDITIVTGLETYSSATAYNQTQTWEIIVPVSGVWRLHGIVPTKNASSSNFFFRATFFEFIRRAD